MNPSIHRIILGALVLLTAIANAADFYVAPNGNDANPSAQTSTGQKFWFDEFAIAP